MSLEITFTERYKGGKERKKNLVDIVQSAAYDSDRGGALENVRQLTEESIRFTAKVVEILHRRGVLNDSEIKEIVDHISNGVDNDHKFVIEHE